MISSYLIKYQYFKNFLIPEQHGAYRNGSAVTNLITFNTEIIKSNINKSYIQAIYTDMSKPFDKLNHEILVIKLESCGINGPLLNWFKSYIHNRGQYVKIKNYNSTPINVALGTPQGSQLSALLYIIFTLMMLKIL